MRINKKLFAYTLIILMLALIIYAFSSCGECEHEWSDWSISAPATCSMQGEEKRQCLNCKQAQTKMTDISEHEYDTENIVWSWDGYKSANAVIYCVNNQSHSRVINASITEETTKQPSCKSNGIKVYTAAISVDSMIYTTTKSEELSASGHAEIADAAIPATCNKTGLTQGSHCSVCNEILVAQKEIPMVDHTVSTIEAVEATCTKEGYGEGKKCSVCKEILVVPQTIAKLPHKELVIEGKAATCSKNGLTQGKICSVCQEVLVPQTIISKTTCSYESIVTSPTCEAQGYTTFICTACGDSYVNGYVNATAHIFGEWEESEDTLLRRCIYNCGKAQRILSITATYNGVRLLTGESVWMDDVTVTATLSDNTVIDIDSFMLENSEMTVNGANYVTVKFKSLSTVLSIPAIYSNLDGTTPEAEFTYTERDDEITITGFLGTSTDIVIPAHIKRVPVRYISSSAFKGQTKITSVIIPDSILSLSSDAFYNCKNLKSVTFGSGLTEIGQSAFYKCVSLTQVDIPINVITIDGAWNWPGAFEGCTGLTSVTIGGKTDNVALTTIGERAFKDCTSLTNINIGESVKVIGNEAFSDCSSLATVTIGKNVEEIGHSAFYKCNSLSSLVIPNNVKAILYDSFYECQNLRSVSFGSGLTEIGHGAFYKCVSLTQVDIPINVITIDGAWNWTGAFEGCTGLTSVTIGGKTDNVALTTIGERAFKDCTSLTNINIGESVKVIGNEAFSDCSSLATVTIGKNVEEIGHSAFYKCNLLSSLVIPNNVKAILYNSFYECQNLRSVSFGSGLTEIGHSAFYNCVSLTQVDIPINVITIDGAWNWPGAFEGCTGLTSVTIGGKTDNVALTAIGERAFKDCTFLTEVRFGNNVKEIADTAFEGCTALQKIIFGTGLKSVGSSVFEGCYSLKSITIPSNLLTIGNGFFKDCTSLVEVVIEKGQEQNRSFGYNIFDGCTNLKRLYYTGSPEEWALITIDESNSFPLDDTPYFYSASKPNAAGDYWYYNDNGEKRVWNVSELAFEAEFSSQVFVEIFGGESSSYSTTLFNSLENYSDFQAGLTAWEALHIIADTSFSEGVWKVSKKDLYKLVIFDLLCGETNAQETLVSSLERSALVYLDDMAKDIFGKDVTSDFLKAVSPKLEYNSKLFGYGITGLQYILESHSNMYDALMSCATYLVLKDMDEHFQTVLLQIENDSLNPWELREAAGEYAEIYEQSSAEILAKFAIEYNSSDARAAFTIFTDILWDKTVEAFFPTFGVAQSLAKGILFLADLNMNLDAIYMAYYKLDVAVHLEASLRNIISNPSKDYLKASHRTAAETYVYAIDMYKTSVLLGFDYSSQFLQEYSANKTGDDKDECITIISNLSSMKQSKKQLFSRFDNLVSQAYAAYYS